MPLEFRESAEGSFFDEVFGSKSSFPERSSSRNPVDLPRAASYNDFTSASLQHHNHSQHEAQSDSTSNDGTRDSSSIDDENKAEDGSSASSGDTTPESETTPAFMNGNGPKPLKSPSEERRLELPKLATNDSVIQRGSAAEREAMTAPAMRDPSSAENDEVRDLPPQSASHLSARFRRRSWMPNSRSPSPAGKRRTAAEGLADTLGSVVRRSSPFRRSVDSDNSDERSRSRSSSLTRKSITSKLAKRPTSGVYEVQPKEAASQVNKPSQLSKSFSTDRLSLSAFSKNKSTTNIPPVPRLSAKDKQRMANIEPTKKKDELWTAFRNLEGDFQKYAGPRTCPYAYTNIFTDFKANQRPSKRMSSARP